jgi:hypothetical protein
MQDTPCSELPPPEPFHYSSTHFFFFYFRAALCVFRCLDTRLEELSASLLAERLKPLFPKQSGADRPGLLVMACCPHRGSARAKQVSNGGKNACSLVHLTVHGLRNLCRGAFSSSSSTLPPSKRDKTLGSGDCVPARAYVLQVAQGFMEAMSRRTNDRAAPSCKSLGRRAPTRTACMT